MRHPCKSCALAFLLAALFMASGAAAIGVSTSRTILDFTPNMTANMTLTVINRENRTINAQLYVRGDLMKYVQMAFEPVEIGPNSRHPLTYTIALPAWLPGPKRYDTRIGAVEIPEEDVPMGAVAGAEAQLWIDVPYMPMPEGFEYDFGKNKTKTEANWSGYVVQSQAQDSGAVMLAFSAALIALVIVSILVLRKSGEKDEKHAI